MIFGTYANLAATNQQQSVSDIQIEREPEIFNILKNDAEPNRDPEVKSLVRSAKLILPKTDESMKDNLPFEEMKSVKKGLGKKSPSNV